MRTRTTSSLRRLLAGTVALLALIAPRTAAAQLPGAPVLQNAFNNPGITVAGNYAGGDNTTLLAAALAYAPGAGRFQFSGGIGRLSLDQGEDDDQSATAWGARLAVPLFSFATGRGGIAPFVGLGAASVDTVKLLQVPVGVGAGWRMGIGATRAFSVYATGTFLWARNTVGDSSDSANRVRFAAAADVTVIRNLGLTLGFEGGANAEAGEPGPTGSIFGVGLSWAFR
jgi:hypothetical protein